MEQAHSIKKSLYSSSINSILAYHMHLKLPKDIKYYNWNPLFNISSPRSYRTYRIEIMHAIGAKVNL